MTSSSSTPTALDVIIAVERHAKSEVAMGALSMTDACEQAMSTMLSRLRRLSDVRMEDATKANEYLATDNRTFTQVQRQSISATLRQLVKSDIAESVMLTAFVQGINNTKFNLRNIRGTYRTKQ